MISNYDIILFDSDNTLYNHFLHERTALDETFELCGKNPLTEDEYLLYRKINSDIWKEIEIGFPKDKNPLVERFRRFKEASGLSFSPDEINAAYIERLSEQCSPFPETFEVCKTLSSTHKLYVITNGTEYIQVKRYNRSPLLPFFSGLFTAASVGIQKPQKGFFDSVLKQIGNPPKNKVLIVGDSLSSDILGGINSGLDTCWFNPQHAQPSKNILPTYEIDTLTALISR